VKGAVRTWGVWTAFFLVFTPDMQYILDMESRNWKQIWTTISSLLLDLGKLSFGGLLLGSVLKGGFDPFQTFVFGAILTVGFFAIGILIYILNRG
jgi:hypothetical protein